MTELILRSFDNISFKEIIESALSERLYNLEQGIKRIKKRIAEFETQYQLSTEEFLTKFNNDELNHRFDFDEWIGEAKMLEYLQQKKLIIEGVTLVN